MLLQHPHRLLHRAFELWILSGNHVFGPILNINVGRNTFILDRPPALAREEPASGAIMLPPSMNGGVSVGPMPIP